MNSVTSELTKSAGVVPKRHGPQKTYTPQQEEEVVNALRDPDFSYSEIAELVGIPLHTVYNINFKRLIRPVKAHATSQPLTSQPINGLWPYKWLHKKDEIIALFKAGMTIHTEISVKTGVPLQTVTRYLTEAGLHAPRKNTTQPKPTVTLIVEADDLEEQRERLKAQLASVERQIQDSTIRVQAQGDEIVIYGMGTMLIRAHWKQWFRFLKSNGAQQIREVITTNFTNGGTGQW